MMSVETIAQLERGAAFAAWQAEVEPYNPASPEECLTWKYGRQAGITNVGSYRPEGWRLVDVVFVDSSGMGRESEAAMTIANFADWASAKVNADETAGFAIIQEGQFQLYVGYFTQDDSIRVEDEATAWVEGEAFSDSDVDYCEN